MPCHYFGLAAISSPWLKDRAFAHNVKEMHEIPAVIIDVMRGGPSTGIPSKTEQSDVNIAIYGGHGEAPRVVVAPTSVRDCMFTGEWAVYLAESLQSPVIVLSDNGARPNPDGGRSETRTTAAAQATY